MKKQRRSLLDEVRQLIIASKLAYIAVDEAKKALFGGTKLRSFDFVIYYPDGRHWLLCCGERTRDRAADMKQWQDIFGGGFRSVFAVRRKAGITFVAHEGGELSIDNPRDDFPPQPATAPSPADRVKQAHSQYQKFKIEYPECILLFRIGDFYEALYDDARTVSRALGVAITSCMIGESQVPLAGIPFHAVESYLRRIIAAGHKVALCEHTDPSPSRLITPPDPVTSPPTSPLTTPKRQKTSPSSPPLPPNVSKSAPSSPPQPSTSPSHTPHPTPVTTFPPATPLPYAPPQGYSRRLAPFSLSYSSQKPASNQLDLFA